MRLVIGEYTARPRNLPDPAHLRYLIVESDVGGEDEHHSIFVLLPILLLLIATVS